MYMYSMINIYPAELFEACTRPASGLSTPIPLGFVFQPTKPKAAPFVAGPVAVFEAAYGLD